MLNFANVVPYENGTPGYLVTISKIDPSGPLHQAVKAASMGVAPSTVSE